jgi:hypothetical protein
MRRASFPVSLLAVLLVILAGPVMGGFQAVAQTVPAASPDLPVPLGEAATTHHHAAASGHAAFLDQRHEADGASHHDGGSSCCVAGCVLAALLDGGAKVPALAPARLVVRRAADDVPERAPSPPHRPPRLSA